MRTALEWAWPQIVNSMLCDMNLHCFVMLCRIAAIAGGSLQSGTGISRISLMRWAAIRAIATSSSKDGCWTGVPSLFRIFLFPLAVSLLLQLSHGIHRVKEFCSSLWKHVLCVSKPTRSSWDHLIRQHPNIRFRDIPPIPAPALQLLPVPAQVIIGETKKFVCNWILLYWMSDWFPNGPRIFFEQAFGDRRSAPARPSARFDVDPYRSRAFWTALGSNNQRQPNTRGSWRVWRKRFRDITHHSELWGCVFSVIRRWMNEYPSYFVSKIIHVHYTFGQRSQPSCVFWFQMVLCCSLARTSPPHHRLNMKGYADLGSDAKNWWSFWEIFQCSDSGWVPCIPIEVKRLEVCKEQLLTIGFCVSPWHNTQDFWYALTWKIAGIRVAVMFIKRRIKTVRKSQMSSK